MASSEDYQATTFAQAQAGLERIHELFPTKGKFRNFMAAGNVFKEVAECPDLSRVDMAQLRRLFREPFEPAEWISALNMRAEIASRGAKRGWEIDQSMMAQLHESFDEAQRKLGGTPVPSTVHAVEIWLGGTIASNLNEMAWWLDEAIRPHGFQLKRNVVPDDICFLGTGYASKELVLRHSFVDLDRLSTSNLPYGFASYNPRFDVLALLAMNPHLVKEMGRKLPQGIMMPGYGHYGRGQHVLSVRRQDTTVSIDWVEVL